MKKLLELKKSISTVNKCWDLFFIKLDWKYNFILFLSKPSFYLVLNLNMIFLQIRGFNPKDQFKSYIQLI